MTLEQLQEKLTTMEADFAKANDRIKALDEEAKKAKERADAAEKRLAVITKLSAEDRALFDAMTSEQQEEIISSDDKQRTAKLAKAREDANREPEIPEAIQKRLDEQAEELRKAREKADAFEKSANEEREARRKAELAKQAENDYGALPGTPEEKAVVLKSLDKLEASEREGVTKLLKAGNAAMSQLTKAEGSESGTANDGDAWSQIEKLATARAAQDKIPFSKATDLVIAENPKLYAAYREEKKQ